MGKPLHTYTLASVVLIIGGYTIGGFGEDGGIEFEFNSPMADFTPGADGEITIDKSMDDSMTCTITLKESSQSYRILATLAAAQRGPGAIEKLGFRMNDAINGDEVSDDYCAFIERPAPSKAKASGERVFKLLLPNAGARLKLGTLNTV